MNGGTKSVDHRSTTEHCDKKTRGVCRAIRVLAFAWVVLSTWILWLVVETGMQSNAPGMRGSSLTRAAAVTAMKPCDFYRTSNNV